MRRSMLVIGGAGGLGSAVAQQARDLKTWYVQVADSRPSAATHLTVDVGNAAQVGSLFRTEGPWDTVVYCAGVSGMAKVPGISLHRTVQHAAEVNYEGAVNALQWWAKQAIDRNFNTDDAPDLQHFVVVSSNSAHIARSGSLAYCASKAAVSMAVRVAARELATTELNVWGVEPGFILDTPMSERFRQNYTGPSHRIPGGDARALTKDSLAAFILQTITLDAPWINGCMLRLDGGEE